MKIIRPAIVLALALGGLSSALPAHPTHAVAASVGTVSFAHLTYQGSTVMGGAPADGASAVAASNPAINTHWNAVNRLIPRLPAPGVAPLVVPMPAANRVVGTNPGFTGFNGLTDLEQLKAGQGRFAGSQSDWEPPDQGLCAGNGFVLESINTASQVFTTNGMTATVVVPLNRTYGQAPYSTHGTAPYGPFIFDPRCYYDADTGHWFLTAAEQDVVPSSGAIGTHSHIEIAVSQTNDPTKQWNAYSIDTTDDGSNGTPKDPGCPCFGDQPLIGADKYGFYITTNEYSMAGSAFNGAQVYAVSKSALGEGTLPDVVVHIGNIPLAGNQAYSIEPAKAPNGIYDTGSGGTEFFMSSLDFSGTGDKRVAAWALTGTSSLDSSTPSVTLSSAVIGSESYVFPLSAPGAQQKPGPTPLREALQDKGQPNPLETLNGDDDRMLQTTYANGMLWSSLNTLVGGTNIAGAYFVVTPAVSHGKVTGTMTKQGYVSVSNENVLYASIGVNSSGKGAIGFTLVGPNRFPSTAYASIDAASGAGSVHVAGAGAKPEDGFTGYTHWGGNGVARWGDYTASLADTDGTIWMAAEYIPNLPRSPLANWGTFISHVTP